jgi:hypothetical protein
MGFLVMRKPGRRDVDVEDGQGMEVEGGVEIVRADDDVRWVRQRAAHPSTSEALGTNRSRTV